YFNNGLGERDQRTREVGILHVGLDLGRQREQVQEQKDERQHRPGFGKAKRRTRQAAEYAHAGAGDAIQSETDEGDGGVHRREDTDERDRGNGRGWYPRSRAAQRRRRTAELERGQEPADQGEQSERLANETAPETAQCRENQEDDQRDIDGVHLGADLLVTPY